MSGESWFFHAAYSLLRRIPALYCPVQLFQSRHALHRIFYGAAAPPGVRRPAPVARPAARNLPVWLESLPHGRVIQTISKLIIIKFDAMIRTKVLKENVDL